MMGYKYQLNEPRKCVRCERMQPAENFRMKGPDCRQSWCKKCQQSHAKERKAEQQDTKAATRPTFVVSDLLYTFATRHARLPMRGRTRSIRAYPTAGMQNKDDHINIVVGRERERVTQPLYGHPTGARYAP
jgi:hypothetical protein